MSNSRDFSEIRVDARIIAPYSVAYIYGGGRRGRSVGKGGRFVENTSLRIVAPTAISRIRKFFDDRKFFTVLYEMSLRGSCPPAIVSIRFTAVVEYLNSVFVMARIRSTRHFTAEPRFCSQCNEVESIELHCLVFIKVNEEKILLDKFNVKMENKVNFI